MSRIISSRLRLIILIFFIFQLTGCVYWRLYQTKVQMEEFDHNFSILVDNTFTLLFNYPILYSNDLLELAKLQPTQKIQLHHAEQAWKYIFRKVDIDNKVLKPEINFYWEMKFNRENRLVSWSLSSLFLKLAPTDFLEASLRSLASAEINTADKQIKSDLNTIDKISTPLPKRLDIKRHIGEPLSIEQRKTKLIYIYRFMLDSPDIETGYENRAISTVKIYFDKHSDELIKMSGRFAGLKIAIDYRKMAADNEQKVVGL